MKWDYSFTWLIHKSICLRQNIFRLPTRTFLSAPLFSHSKILPPMTKAWGNTRPGIPNTSNSNFIVNLLHWGCLSKQFNYRQLWMLEPCRLIFVQLVRLRLHWANIAPFIAQILDWSNFIRNCANKGYFICSCKKGLSEGNDHSSSEWSSRGYQTNFDLPAFLEKCQKAQIAKMRCVFLIYIYFHHS